MRNLFIVAALIVLLAGGFLLLLPHEDPATNEADTSSPTESTPAEGSKPKQSISSDPDSEILDTRNLSWPELQEEVKAYSEATRQRLEKTVVSRIVESFQGRPWYINLVRMAGALRISQPEVVARLDALSIRSREALKVPATISLCLIEPKKADGLISPLFTKANPTTRKSSCAIAALINQSWVWPLVENSLLDSDPGVREEAVKAVGHAPRVSDSAKDAVLEIAKTGTKLSRMLALGLLAKWSMTGPKALDTLRVCVSASAPEVRRAAATGLSAIQTEDSRELLETLAQDSDADVRRVAITALGDSGEGNKELALKLSDADPAVRCAALDALAKNPPQEVSSVIQRASMDESSKVRASLAGLLAVIPAAAADSLLVGMLNDEDESVADAAIDSLTKRKKARNVALILKSLASKKASFSHSVKALEKLTGKTLGQGPGAKPSEREPTIKAWEAWWKKSKRE